MKAGTATYKDTRPCRHLLAPRLPGFYYLFVLALGLVIVFGGCSDDFDPLTETETDFFAIFGYLDTSADTQFVRISPLRETLDEVLDANNITVTSTSLSSGQRIVWNDSLLQLDDGQTGLLFYAILSVDQDERYRLDVRGPDGKETRAYTQTPAFFSLQTEPPVHADNVYRQTVIWDGLTMPPAQAVLSYRIQEPNKSMPDTLMVPLQDAGRAFDDGWRYTISLSQDRFTILDILQRPVDDDTVILLDIQLEIEQRSEEWQRINQSPLNIANGFGFFGAVAKHGQTWTLEPSVARQIGFASDSASTIPLP